MEWLLVRWCCRCSDRWSVSLTVAPDAISSTRLAWLPLIASCDAPGPVIVRSWPMRSDPGPLSCKLVTRNVAAPAVPARARNVKQAAAAKQARGSRRRPRMEAPEGVANVFIRSSPDKAQPPGIPYHFSGGVPGTPGNPRVGACGIVCSVARPMILSKSPQLSVRKGGTPLCDTNFICSLKRRSARFRIACFPPVLARPTL
jgi:hypothetical protein